MAELKISGMTDALVPLDAESKIEISTTSPSTFSAKLKNTSDFVIATATDNIAITENASKYMLIFTRQGIAKIITLPDATSNIGQTIVVNVNGAGVGDVSLAGTGSQTINGELINTWKWYGNGTLTIVSDGSNYITMPGVYDSGVLTSVNFTRDTCGKMDLWGIFTGTTDTLDTDRFGSTAGAMYSVDITITYIIAFATGTTPIVTSTMYNGMVGVSYNQAVISNTSIDMRILYKFNSAAVGGTYKLIGVWY